VSIFDALHRMCHRYPGGIELLAQRMRLSRSMLNGMANPNDGTHNWSLVQFREAMHFANDTAPLEALCTEFDGVFVPMPKAAGRGFDKVFEELAALAKEFGDIPREVMAGLQDGRLQPKEYARIETEVMELQQKAAELLLVLKPMVGHPPIRSVKSA